MPIHMMRRMLASAATVLCAVSAVAAEETREAPAFIRMYGEWESVAVRAEPPSVLEAMPALAAPHHIIGEPVKVQPGVHFIVEQETAGKTQLSELTYAYDTTADKSFGVITGGDGSVLRGVIEHHATHDILRLYNAAGDVVWTERNVWTSPDMLISEAAFMHEGSEARVWFETQRKTRTDSE